MLYNLDKLQPGHAYVRWNINIIAYVAFYDCNIIPNHVCTVDAKVFLRDRL